MLGGAHAEADRDRQAGVALDARDRRRDVSRIGHGRTRDAGDGDVIDEARRIREHGGQALVVGRRRRQADKIHPGLERRQAQLLVLLGRQVNDDESVDAGGFRIPEKAVDAINVDRVVVSHEHQRRRIVGLAKRAGDFERLAHGLPGLERALRRHLDRRPVGHGIGERHAELDQIRAGSGEGAQNGE